jgi:Cadherin domain
MRESRNVRRSSPRSRTSAPLTGAVSIGVNGNLIDYETSGVSHSYNITVQASDNAGGGNTLTTSQTFAIAVANANPSTPTDSDTANANTVVEGATTGTYTGLTASSTDPNDPVPSVTYSLTDDAGGRFAIDSVTGAVNVGANAHLIDFESATGHAYSITVQASDGAGGLSSQIFAIAVGDAPPTNWTDANAGANTVIEGAANGIGVGITAQAFDPNGGTVAYSLTNNAGGRFTIDPVSGVVTILDGSLIDYESAPGHAYTITVQGSDGVQSSTHDFSIDVTNEAPSVPVDNTAPTGGSVAEGATATTTVGITAHATDVNGGTIAYSLSNSAGGLFAIDSSSGIVTVTAAGPSGIDFESTSPGHSYSITVDASDGNRSSSQSFTIAVTNVPPSAPADSDGVTGGSVSELASNGDTVGITLSSSDPNGGATISYSLTDSQGGRFAVDPNTGVVTVSAIAAAVPLSV